MLTKDNIDYRQLILADPLKSFEFLADIMDFEPVKNIDDLNREILIQNKTGNYFKLLLKSDCSNQEPVLIYSDDCLSDYFELKTKGICFVKGPHYRPEGLTVEFTDRWGNNYILLEKRVYEEEV